MHWYTLIALGNQIHYPLSCQIGKAMATYLDLSNFKDNNHNFQNDNLNYVLCNILLILYILNEN